MKITDKLILITFFLAVVWMIDAAVDTFFVAELRAVIQSVAWGSVPSIVVAIALHYFRRRKQRGITT